MIRQFNQTLFIARSSESVELYLSTHSGSIKAITLSALLSSEEFKTSVAMDAMIGKMVLRRATESLSLEHFDYLSRLPMPLSVKSIRISSTASVTILDLKPLAMILKNTMN